MNAIRSRAPVVRPLSLLAVAIVVVAVVRDAREFVACWFAAWYFWLGVCLGAHANAWVHRLSAGAWGAPIAEAADLLGRRMPRLLVAALPALAGGALLYPWAGDGEWAHHFHRPEFPLLWFSTPFVTLRLIGYAAFWWWATRPVTRRRAGAAVGGLALHLVVGTLAAFDLVASLVPGWFSSAFGLVVLTGQSLGGTAAAILLAARTRCGVEAVPWRDLGNLLLAWTLLWAYVAFMQFLIIWAEDLPAETQWYRLRLDGGWSVGGMVLTGLLFALPVLALLFRRVKDDPRRLAIAAGASLTGQWLNTAWLVLPSVDPHSLAAWWLLPAATAAIAAWLFHDLDPRPDARRRTSETVGRISPHV